MAGIVYQFAKEWDGRSPDPNDKKITYKNHDSKMDKDEVLRLVQQGVQLLMSQKSDVIKGTGDEDLLKAWRDLEKSKDITSFVTIFKGIHQRWTKPHITARVIGGATLHFWLTATDTGLSSLPGFTYSVSAVSATALGGRVPTTTVVGIRRRGSVSYSVVNNEKLRLAADAAALEDQLDSLLALEPSEV